MQTLSLSQRLTYQYEGFLKGGDIRAINSIQDFNPFTTAFDAPPNKNTLKLWKTSIPPRLVLGKRVEYFMSDYLQEHPSYKILAQNTQVFREKVTIGELDFLIQDIHTQQVIHLEQVYKFYLYLPNATLYKDDPWIGPNYKDSFQLKMDKLKNKQFPLLHKEETQIALKHLSIDFSNVQQQLSFKATLFLPFDTPNLVFSTINNRCIEGIWMRLENFKALYQHQSFQFFLPQKQDWGLAPQYNSSWFSFSCILPKIQASLAQKRAPMCWIKTSNTTYQKCFVVWW